MLAAAVTGESAAHRLDSVYITGNTPFEVGKALGEYEREKLHELMAIDPLLLESLRPWKAAHEAEYNAFVAANRARFPRYFEEMEGIASGAGVALEDLILTALGPEIDTLQQNENGGNCFDTIGVPVTATGHSRAIIGHNEDLGPEYKAFSFLVTIHQPYAAAAEAAGTAHTITAFVYPGAPLGFTFGWNNAGMVYSCNGIFPAPRTGGLGRYFINRYVLEATSFDEALSRLRSVYKDAALGFGTTLGKARSDVVYNVEIGPGVMSIVRVPPGESLLHSNMYSHNDTVHVYNNFAQTTTHRLTRAHQLPPPMTREAVVDILGDTLDPVFPIYRDGKKPDFLSTSATVIFDLENARAEVFGGNPKFTHPTAVFNFDPTTENTENTATCGPDGICDKEVLKTN